MQRETVLGTLSRAFGRVTGQYSAAQLSITHLVAEITSGFLGGWIFCSEFRVS